MSSRWKRIAVSLAGPGAGFVLWGLIWLLLRSADVKELNELALSALVDLWFINLAWGLLNLLPIWPLDGGQVSRDFLAWLLPGRGTSIALGISFVTAGLLAINTIYTGANGEGLPLLREIPFLGNMKSMYTVLLFGWLAFNSYQAMQFEARHRYWDRDRPDEW